MRAMTIVLVLCLVSVAALSSAEERLIEIRAKKFSYTPNIISVNRGDTIRIRLISEDVHHGFFLDGYNLETSALPGQDGSIKFLADKGGKFNFRCSVTCGEFHPYMVGNLTVEPNSRFRAFAGLAVIFAVAGIVVALTKKRG